MIKIQQDAMGRYRINIGDGKRGGYPAKTLEEVKMALAHYFSPVKPITHYDWADISPCPLCEAMKREGK